MNFLKTLFWVVAAIVLVVFALNNWQPVTVKLWDGLQLDTKLPLLVIGAFLVGFFPTWLLHRTVRWRLNRRITSLEASHYRDQTSTENRATTEKRPARGSTSTPLSSPAPEAPPAVSAD